MSREFFLPHALEVAPLLLGAQLTVQGNDAQGNATHGSGKEQPVTIRITEVEAYHGVGVPGPYDSGSHSKDRRTERNASMFGPPGHAYVYFTYGMHYALNLVCSPEGTASGVLIRSGEVIAGADAAHSRREAKRGRARGGADAAGRAPILPHLLARGPGNLATSLGIERQTHDGLDLFDHPFTLELPGEPLGHGVRSGPRVGVGGVAGSSGFPWRFWIADDPTVSAYRPGRNVPRPEP